jgi:hypothetical protein
LFPALRVKKIFDAIASKYDLVFQSDFFNTLQFTELFLHFKNKETFTFLAKLADVDFVSFITRVPTDINPNIYDNNYFLVNGQYICGGFFPPFVRWDSNLVPSENYTRNDLVQLSTTLAILISTDDTNYQIYEKIRTFIDEKESSPSVDINLVRNRFDPELSTPYEYLKIPIKTIIYTIRPRFGVPLPGEVYNVVLDKTNVYGVPFRFQDGIPVYSIKLKELVENKFVIIEGPSFYEETSETNFIKSNYYISIEYTDQRGLKIFFREGVSKKKIIQKQAGYSACDRFNDRVSCNDPNSFSLELKGKRYKCTWKKTCVKFDDTKFFEDIDNFDMRKVVFLETYKQEEWNNALKLSLKYIEDKIVSEKLSPGDIDILKNSQKTKLVIHINICELFLTRAYFLDTHCMQFGVDIGTD